MDIRGGMQIIIENVVVCQKGGKVTNGGVVGNVYCKMQKFVLQKSE